MTTETGPRRAAALLAALLALALVAAACGDADPETTESGGTTDDATETTATDDDAMDDDSMDDDSMADEAMADDDQDADHSDGDGDEAAADVVIEASVAGGEVTVDSDRIDVPLNSTVAIRVTSDVTEHVHLHGYDHLVDIAAGDTGIIEFVADIPGVFEVELEDSRTFLFEISVS